jgi:hypothetical protein
MENIRLLEDEEFIQENSDQVTPIKDISTPEDEKSAQLDYVESSSHLKIKTLQILGIVGVKEDWISVTLIMKIVGEL